MVLYFSGTGNTRFAAEGIARLTGDKLCSMKELIRTGRHQKFRSDRPFVICAPIYAWRFPRIVESFIRRSDFSGSRKFYFVATCDSQTGGAEKYLKRLCFIKHMQFGGMASVAMPENYIAMYDAPSAEEKEKIFSHAYREITDIAALITEGRKLYDVRRSFLGRALTTIANPAFYSFLVSTKPFHVTNACTGCGKCVKGCIFKSISLKDGKPVWNGKCTHCMACINGCPAKAIEYGSATEGRDRYFNTLTFEEYEKLHGSKDLHDKK